MESSTFIAKIVMRGNSATVTIPKGNARVFGIGKEVKVTLEDKQQ